MRAHSERRASVRAASARVRAHAEKFSGLGFPLGLLGPGDHGQRSEEGHVEVLA